MIIIVFAPDLSLFRFPSDFACATVVQRGSFNRAEEEKKSAQAKYLVVCSRLSSFQEARAIASDSCLQACGQESVAPLRCHVGRVYILRKLRGVYGLTSWHSPGGCPFPQIGLNFQFNLLQEGPTIRETLRISIDGQVCLSLRSLHNYRESRRKKRTGCQDKVHLQHPELSGQ